MKKRLLIFHPTIAPYRIDFFNDLSKSFDAKICLSYKNLKSQTFDYDTIEKQFIFEPYYLSSGFLINKVVEAYRIISIIKPDVIITSEFGTYTLLSIFLKLLRLSAARVIVISDDNFNMVVENNDFTLLHKLARKLCLQYIDDIVTPDDRICKWYQEKIKKGLFFPIIRKESIVRSAYKLSQTRSEIIRKLYGLDGKNVFLFVGRIVGLKNLDSVIDAFSKLPQKQNLMVIVGSGPEEDYLKKLSVHCGANVLFTGRLEGEALYAWYNVAKCLVLASTQEAFGAVTNEALLGGCYGLISNKAGSSCLIEENVNGLTFNPYDTKELVEKMNTITSWPEVKCDKDGIRQSMMPFCFKSIMDSLICGLIR